MRISSKVTYFKILESPIFLQDRNNKTAKNGNEISRVLKSLRVLLLYCSQIRVN